MAEQTEENNELSIRATLFGLLRYRWLIAGITLAVTAAVAAWTYSLPRIYRASTTIEFAPNPVRPLGNDVDDVGEPVGSYFATQEFLQTQIYIISSRAVLERVVQALELHRDPRFFYAADAQRGAFRARTVQQTALELRSRVSVEPQEETQLVRIHVEDRNPARARTLADAIATAYINKVTDERSRTTVDALQFLATELTKTGGQLRGYEVELHAFKQQHEVLSVSMEDRQNIVASNIERFNQAWSEARIERIRAEARLAQLRLSNDEDPLVAAPAFGDGETLQSLRQLYREKHDEFESLSTRYGASHPRMVALHTEIERLRQLLREEIQGLITLAQSQVAEARLVEAGFSGALQQANQEGLAINELEIEYNRLNRERTSQERLHNLLLERAAEANLIASLRVRHAEVLESALVPDAYVRPRVSMNIAAGFLAGLALSIALSVLLSRMDRRVRGAEHIEALGIAMLGAVPKAEEDEQSTNNNKKVRLVARKAVDGTPELGIIVQERPLSMVAEHCRSVRTNLLFMSADQPLRAMLITSMGAAEGKTFVSLNLAAVFAQSGKKVLLVDSDLRRPRVHRALKIGNRVGLTSRLVGQASLASVVQPTEVEGLSVLTSGPIPPNPAELLHSTKFHDFLEEAKSVYDLVIFDSPPVGAVTDASVLAPQLDGVVLVVRSNVTSRDAVRRAVKQMTDIGARIFGTVLNDVDFMRPGYGSYYYQRGYYYQADEADTKAAE